MRHKPHRGDAETRSSSEIPSGTRAPAKPGVGFVGRGAREPYCRYALRVCPQIFAELKKIFRSRTLSLLAETQAPEARNYLAPPEASEREAVRVGKLTRILEPRRGGTRYFVVLAIVFLFVYAETNLFSQQPLTVQFPDLRATPAKFHKKTIQLRGFFLNEFENRALYATDQWEHAKGILITPVVDIHLPQTANRHYAVATGVFDANDHGHLGQFRGNLKLTRLALDEGSSGK